MERQQLLQTAKARCEELQKQYSECVALQSIIAQIDYLVRLESGQVQDRSRLHEITIGILTAREIEPRDMETAELLHQVAGEIRRM